MPADLFEALTWLGLAAVVVQGFIGYRRTGNAGFLLVALALGLQAAIGFLATNIAANFRAADDAQSIGRRLFAVRGPATLLSLAVLGAGFWRLGRLPRYRRQRLEADSEGGSGP